MSEMSYRLQQHFKKSSAHFLLLMARILMGLMLGITVATVCQVLLGFDQFMYIFFTLATALVFLRLTKGWSFVRVLVLALVLVLAGMLVRFYVMMAAGS